MQMNGLGISLDDINMNEVRKNIDKLDEREKYIITKMTGLNGHIQSLNSIAEDLGISRERTRQIAIIAIGKLNAASEKDKEEVIEQLLYYMDNLYDGEIPKSFDIKNNHSKLYWKIRGTFGGYTKLVDEVKQRRHIL